MRVRVRVRPLHAHPGGGRRGVSRVARERGLPGTARGQKQPTPTPPSRDGTDVSVLWMAAAAAAVAQQQSRVFISLSVLLRASTIVHARLRSCVTTRWRANHVAMHLDPAPLYARALALLRDAPLASWPTTPAAHARIVDGWGVDSSAHTMTIARDVRRGSRPPLANKRFPELAAALFDLERALRESGEPSASCVVMAQACLLPHRAPGRGEADSRMLAVALGEHTGGELVVEGMTHPIRQRPHEYDGWNRLSWTRPFEGERYALQFYSSSRDSLAALAAKVVAAQTRPFRYREQSTDVNVICEVLAPPGAYSGPAHGDPRWADTDFSPRGHVVLDLGAHIGAFSTWALSEGAERIVAFEPEDSNAELLAANLADAIGEGNAEVCRAAVASGPAGTAQLVLGKARSDGVANTWRHALEGSSHYRDGGVDGDALTRVQVPTRPLFGASGVLSEGISYVKMDIEGAELALLRGYERGAWRGVTRIAIEYSFTKAPAMADFVEVVDLLEREGFTTMYEGKGSWERMAEWPWHMDALLFAAK